MLAASISIRAALYFKESHQAQPFFDQSPPGLARRASTPLRSSALRSGYASTVINTTNKRPRLARRLAKSYAVFPEGRDTPKARAGGRGAIPPIKSSNITTCVQPPFPVSKEKRQNHAKKSRTNISLGMVILLIRFSSPTGTKEALRFDSA